MPIVGIVSSRVIRAAIACGISSSTMANAPACFGRLGVAQQHVLVALNLPHPAERVDRLRLHPFVGHDRNARHRQGANRLGLRLAPFELDRRPPRSPSGFAPRFRWPADGLTW